MIIHKIIGVMVIQIKLLYCLHVKGRGSPPQLLVDIFSAAKGA
jgi:hypothetical protein